MMGLTFGTNFGTQHNESMGECNEKPDIKDDDVYTDTQPFRNFS